MTDLEFIDAHPGDLDAVRALLQAAGLPTADVATALPGTLVVARDAEGLAGCVAIEPLQAAGWALVRSLAVAPRAQGRGLGRRLLAEAHSRARSAARVHLVLLTTTAAPFFVANGYAAADRATLPDRVRRHPQFSGLCPSSATCLVRHLAPGGSGATKHSGVAGPTN